MSSSPQKKRKRKRLSKKQEERELIRFLDYEQDELPYELRTYQDSGNSGGFEILSVDSYYLNNATNANTSNIPMPAKSTPKPPP